MPARLVLFFAIRPRSLGVIDWQMELEEAVRKGNEKFNTMITEQLMAQEDIRRAAEAEAKVTKHVYPQNHVLW